MKINWKKLLNFLFIAATLTFILFTAFRTDEMTDAWQALFTLRPQWLFAAFMGWFCYLFFDALSLYFFLRKQGYALTLAYALYVSLIGFYYSNITPGASGGQPMQIYYLNKRGIPVGVGTSVISIKLFCMVVSMVFIGVALWMMHRDAVAAQLGGLQWVAVMGVVVNFAAVPFILLAALYRPLVQRVVNFGIRLGAKMRLIKNPESATLRVSAMLDTYHASILQVRKDPFQILVPLLLTGLSMLGLFSIPVSVYYAFGLSGTSWPFLLTLSCLLFLSACYTPLPGASGAQEGGFLAFFSGIFPASTIGVALLVWRFMSYYLLLLVGGAVTIFTSLRFGRKKTPKNQEQDGASPQKAP